MLRFCVILFMLLALSALGQDKNLTSKIYRGEEIPTGVAFRHAIAFYRYQVAEGESNNVVEEIQYEFKVDFNTADDLLVLFIEESMAIDADISAISDALACLDGDPWEIMAQWYDVDEDVGLIHYKRFRKRLDKSMAWKIDDWMEDIKYGMVYGRIDYESSYRKAGRDVSDARAELARRCRTADIRH